MVQQETSYKKFLEVKKQKKIPCKQEDKNKPQNLIEEIKRLKKQIKNLKRELKKQVLKNEKLSGKLKAKIF